MFTIVLYGKEKEKATINTLLNPDDFYGRFTGNIGVIIKFLVISVLPFLVYTFFLIPYIPMKWVLWFEGVWVFITFLKVIGRQDQRLAAYRKKRANIYSSVEDLMSIKAVHNDGLIEYDNGIICYVVQTFTHCYFVDDVFARDCELFLEKVSKISPNYDIYGFLVTDDLKLLKEDLERLSVYQEDWARSERLGFYKRNEQYHIDNSKLYSLNFILYAYRNNYHNLKTKAEALVKSDASNCFKVCKIASYDEALKILSRDSTLFVDINGILKQKYSSTETYGSRVLYFNDERQVKSTSDLSERRIEYDR